MITAKEVAEIFEQIAPLNVGIPDDKLGFLYGDPGIAVTGVGCAWCVHTQSLRTCVERGLNLVICHEDLWMPVQSSHWYQAPPEAEIFGNRARREILDRNRITVYRSHSNWDALPTHGVPDRAVAALGLAGAKEISRRKFFSVIELANPMTVEQLQQRVARGLGFPSCRIFGDPGMRVRRFAFLIGGFGANQWHMPQVARDLGAEAIIIGEMHEFIAIACLEMGMPVIESLHSASEIPAIRTQAAILAERLKPLRVEYVPSGATLT
jgi:putative NIF3 family GTP cyclohydrolase 1 type 2